MYKRQGLPTADDSWNFKTFTKDEYETLKTKIASGELVVDNSSDDATKPTVSAVSYTHLSPMRW